MKYLLFFLLLFGCTSPQKEEMGLLPVNGTKLYYHAIGTGDPLIVIHGGPVLDQSYMIDHFSALAKTHRLIFFDQRVSGRSVVDVDTASMTIGNLVEDIESLRQKLGLKEVSVLGHSWGGMLAAMYAIEYPLKVKRLVLCDPMPPSFRLISLEEREHALRVSSYDSALQEKIRAQSGFKNHEVKWVDSLMKISFKREFYDTTKLALLKIKLPDDYFRRMKIFEHIWPELYAMDITLQLEKIIAPTLIIYGEIEPGTKISGPVYKKSIADAQLAIIARSGHFPFIEQSVKFDSTVNAFLDATPQ